MNFKKESLTIISEDEYYGYLRTVNSFSFLQEPPWGNVKSDSRRILIGIYQEKQLVGAAMVLVVNLISKYTALYIARGPVLDYSNGDILHTFHDGITKLAKENNAIFVRTDPNVINENHAPQDVSNFRNSFAETIAALKKAGFHHNGLDIKIRAYWPTPDSKSYTSV